MNCLLGQTVETNPPLPAESHSCELHGVAIFGAKDGTRRVAFFGWKWKSFGGTRQVKFNGLLGMPGLKLGYSDLLAYLRVFRVQCLPFSSFFPFSRFKKSWAAPPSRLPVRQEPFGLPEGTGAAPMTGAPTAHCFMRSPRPEPRGLYGLATRLPDAAVTNWFSILHGNASARHDISWSATVRGKLAASADTGGADLFSIFVLAGCRLKVKAALFEATCLG